MNFNFIATTFRYHEDSLIDELKDLFYEFEDLSVICNKTNIDGIIVGSCLKNPIDFVLFLRNKIRDVPWEIRYLLRFLPVEKVYKVANGKKVMRERNYYPGYVMIEIANGKLNDDLRDIIKNTTNVIHFLGKENPIALRKAEVNKMLGKMDEMAEAGGSTMSEPFIVGATIKIIEGPFNDFNGVIEEVNDEKKKLKVTGKIVGRSTPVELNYMQVEKLS